MDDDLDHLPIRSPSAPLAPLTPLPFARQQQQQQNYHQQQLLPPITHPAPTQQQQQQQQQGQQGQGPSIRIANFMDISLSGRCSRSSSSNNKDADDLILDDLEEFHDIDIFDDTPTEREREREMQRGRLSLPAINSHKRAVAGGQHQQQQQQQLGAHIHGDVSEGANWLSGGGSGVVRKLRMSCRSRPPLPPQSRPSKGAGGAGMGPAGGAAAEQTMINGTHDEAEGVRRER